MDRIVEIIAERLRTERLVPAPKSDDTPSTGYTWSRSISYGQEALLRKKMTLVLCISMQHASRITEITDRPSFRAIRLAQNRSHGHNILLNPPLYFPLDSVQTTLLNRAKLPVLISLNSPD
jgi:hypothetical protein